MLKMNIKKRSKNDSVVDSFKIWFGDIGTIARLFDSPIENDALQNFRNEYRIENTEFYC